MQTLRDFHVFLEICHATVINRRRLEARRSINEGKAVWTEINKPKRKNRSGRFGALEELEEE